MRSLIIGLSLKKVLMPYLDIIWNMSLPLKKNGIGTVPRVSQKSDFGNSAKFSSLADQMKTMKV